MSEYLIQESSCTTEVTWIKRVDVMDSVMDATIVIYGCDGCYGKSEK